MHWGNRQNMKCNPHRLISLHKGIVSEIIHTRVYIGTLIANTVNWTSEALQHKYQLTEVKITDFSIKHTIYQSLCKKLIVFVNSALRPGFCGDSMPNNSRTFNFSIVITLSHESPYLRSFFYIAGVVDSLVFSPIFMK